MKFPIDYIFCEKRFISQRFVQQLCAKDILLWWGRG